MNSIEKSTRTIGSIVYRNCLFVHYQMAVVNPQLKGRETFGSGILDYADVV